MLPLIHVGLSKKPFFGYDWAGGVGVDAGVY